MAKRGLPNAEALFERELTRKQFLLLGALTIASVTGILGFIKLLNSSAAAPALGIEPEDGALNGAATAVPVASASGGEAVRFGTRTNDFTTFTPGSVKPLGYADEAAGLGRRNVGPRLTSFTRHDGDYVLTPGAQVSGLEIFGRLTGRGDSRTRVTDCIVHGSTTPSGADSAAVVGNSYDLGGAVIEWCRIDVTANRGFTDVVAGGNYILRYSELAGGVDGIGAKLVGNATIEACRIWNGYYFAWWDAAAGAPRTAPFVDAKGMSRPSPFPAQSSGDTHSDGMQIHQDSGWVLRGCYLGGNRGATPRAHLDPTLVADYNLMQQLDSGREFVNAGILISSASAARKVGAVIEDNWLEGGAARLNLAWKDYDSLGGVTVRRNKFVRSNYGYYIYRHRSNASILDGNVFEDTGAAVPIVNWG